MIKSFDEMNYDEMKANLEKDICTHNVVKDVIGRFEKTDIVDMWNDLDLIIAVHKKYRAKYGL